MLPYMESSTQAIESVATHEKEPWSTTLLVTMVTSEEILSLQVNGNKKGLLLVINLTLTQKPLCLKSLHKSQPSCIRKLCAFIE